MRTTASEIEAWSELPAGVVPPCRCPSEEAIAGSLLPLRDEPRARRRDKSQTCDEVGYEDSGGRMLRCRHGVGFVTARSTSRYHEGGVTLDEASAGFESLQGFSHGFLRYRRSRPISRSHVTSGRRRQAAIRSGGAGRS